MQWSARLAAAKLEGFGHRFKVISKLLCQNHDCVTFSHKVVGVSIYITRKSFMLYLLYKRSEFLAGKKFLLFKAPFALAALTTERHLART